MSSVSTCSIIEEDPDNVSDHLPVRIKFTLHLDQNNTEPRIKPNNIAQPNWSNTSRNSKYLQTTTNKLSQIGKLPIPRNESFNMKDILNKILLDINNILIESASESGCVPHKSLKPKAYWCPELSALRDKK